MTDTLEPTAGMAVSIYTALLGVQRDLEVQTKDAKNPHFKSSYLSLPALLRSCRPVLSEHGVVLIQQPGKIGDGMVEVCTTLYHAESDTKVEGCVTLPVQKKDAQGIGSCITYGRRYVLTSLLGLEADDDDGHQASQRGATKRPQAPPAKSLNQQRDEAIAYFATQGVSKAALEEHLNSGASDWTAQTLTSLRSEMAQIISAYAQVADNPTPAE